MNNKTKLKTLNQILYNNGYECHALSELLTAKVLDILQIDNFCGIQPLQGPVGLIYRLVYDKIINEVDDSDTRLTLQVKCNGIEAKSVIPKSILDLKSMNNSIDSYGDYMLNQYLHFMAIEICYELHQEMVNIIHENSSLVDYRIDLDGSPSENLSKLYKASNRVGFNSRRGMANSWLLPKIVFHNIKDELGSTFAPYHSDEKDIQKVGTLNNYINIFVSDHSTSALVHHKGTTGSEIDTNIVFSPFTILPFEEADILKTKCRYNFNINNCDYTVKLQVR
jgi:hypothetical protein